MYTLHIGTDRITPANPHPLTGEAMRKPVPWHPLFEVVCADLCRGTALDAEAEQVLSLKQQFLDLTRTREGAGLLPEPPP
jgi:hypothetical protein